MIVPFDSTTGGKIAVNIFQITRVEPITSTTTMIFANTSIVAVKGSFESVIKILNNSVKE